MRLAALEAELRRVSQQKDADLAKLRATVDALSRDRDSMKAELAASAKQRDAFGIEIASVARAREKLASELEMFLREHSGTNPQIRTAADHDELSSRIDGLARAEASVRTELAELRARLETAEKTLGKTASSPDDLRRIRGVGPRFETALLERGFDSYAKIAGWTDETIEEVAKAIGTTPERIRREGWVASAKRLAGA